MPSIDISNAAARQQAFKTTTPATCLRTAARAILRDKPAITHALTALQAWNESPGKHRGKLPPAPGFPGYWTGDGGRGDVCLYLGNGRWSAIDWNGTSYAAGVIASETTAQRSAQVGGTYQGYSSEFLGYTLFHPSLASAGAVTALTRGGSDMAAPKVFTRKINGQNTWMRAWEKTVDITTVKGHAAVWKLEAGQTISKTITQSQWDYIVKTVQQRAAGTPVS